jgi:hypothetical protein
MDPSVLTVYKSPFPKVRLGKDFDGGYVIADIPNVNYSLLLACGICNDISFETDFLNKYPNTTCYAYDGTINMLPQQNNKIIFVKKNIGYENDNNTTNLNDMIYTNTGIFIKMDIEGSEIPWLKTLSNQQLNKFEQIVLEFHFPFNDNEKNVFDKINKNHYLVHFHGNNCCGTRLHNDVIIPNVFECTYLHKKYFTSVPELNTDPIPGVLDMKNMYHDEIYINHPPFVN